MENKQHKEAKISLPNLAQLCAVSSLLLLYFIKIFSKQQSMKNSSQKHLQTSVKVRMYMQGCTIFLPVVLACCSPFPHHVLITSVNLDCKVFENNIYCICIITTASPCFRSYFTCYQFKQKPSKTRLIKKTNRKVRVSHTNA